MSDYENEKTFAATYLNDVYPLEPVAPVEAKEKVCANCNHKSHYALRCGALLATGSDGEFTEEVRCECLNWVAEPKPTPPTRPSIFGELGWEGIAGAIIDKVHMTPEDYVNEELVEQLKRFFVPKPQPDSSSIDWEQEIKDISIAVIQDHDIPDVSKNVVIRNLAWAIKNRTEPKTKPSDSFSTLEIELELRRMMWLSHGHTGMYGDDGEMQCDECRPFGAVDYKNETLDKVRETFRAVQMECMMKPRDSSSISTEPEPLVSDEIVNLYAEDDEPVSTAAKLAKELQQWRKWAKGQSNVR